MLALTTPALAKDKDKAKDKDRGDHGLRNAVVLIIRHAEKPDKGNGLSDAGLKRAQAYVNYFQNFTVVSAPLKVDYLFSTADSKESCRTRLTLEPFSKATGLAIDSRFRETQTRQLADAVRKKPSGKQTLICWHHGEIPQLVSALGANSDTLFPDKKWPDAVFDWVIQLRYDAEGRVMDAKRINEALMPGDSGK